MATSRSALSTDSLRRNAVRRVRRTRACGVAAAMLAVAGAAWAQDEAPYTWTVTGTTVEALEVTFAQRVAPDVTTPEGVVEAYLALTDRRSAAEAIDAAAARAAEAAVRGSLAPLEAALLTPEARAALAEHLAAVHAEREAEAARYQVSAAPSRIVSVDYADDWAYVETRQIVTVRELWTPPDDWDIYDEEVVRKFACMNIDGRWFVQRVQVWSVDSDRSSVDEPVYAWLDESSPLVEFYQLEGLDVPEPRALLARTPEDAALALFETLLVRATEVTRAARVAMLRDKMLALEDLSGPAITFQTLRRAELRMPQRTIASVERFGDEALVTLAPASAGRTVVRVRRDGTAWRIRGAAYYRTFVLFDETVESLVEVPNVYEVQ